MSVVAIENFRKPSRGEAELARAFQAIAEIQNGGPVTAEAEVLSDFLRGFSFSDEIARRRIVLAMRKCELSFAVIDDVLREFDALAAKG